MCVFLWSTGTPGLQVGKALPLSSYGQVLFSSWPCSALGPLPTSQEPLKDKLGSALGLSGTGMFCTQEALGLIPRTRKIKRQAAKGFADSTSYVKESPVPLPGRDKGVGGCKPEAHLSFWQGNAYLTMPERRTAHRLPDTDSHVLSSPLGEAQVRPL